MWGVHAIPEFKTRHDCGEYKYKQEIVPKTHLCVPLTFTLEELISIDQSGLQTTMSFDRLFSSTSLIYRAIENDEEDKAFLRRIRMDDLTGYTQSSNQLLRPMSLNDASKMVESMSKSFLAVMICIPPEPTSGSQEPEPIGSLEISAFPNTRQHRVCTLEFSFAVAHQGKGYGTEAMNWAVDWAFRVAGMHSVRLICFSFNERAARLYERLGFVREGVSREVYFYDGKWHDHILFSMLEREWAALRAVQ